jgi:hypothetical protein
MKQVDFFSRKVRKHRHIAGSIALNKLSLPRFIGGENIDGALDTSWAKAGPKNLRPK